jgi:hypothetical protein
MDAIGELMRFGHAGVVLALVLRDLPRHTPSTHGFYW